MYDYLSDSALNLGSWKKDENLQGKVSLLKSKNKKNMTSRDRSYGIQKILDLNQRKDYKSETLFLAASILDKYIMRVGVENFAKEKMLHLATTSTLLAAKLEEPIAPSFSMTMSHLSKVEQKYVTKKDLLELEGKIMVTLGFNFNFPSPIPSLERYLRLLDYH